MDRFEHRLRTTLHTKIVQGIMSRVQVATSHSPKHRQPLRKVDNITTYLRKVQSIIQHLQFQIDHENENLAKRITLCESQHSRDRYAKEWKKVQSFLKVRSNFKRTLYAQEPRIFKVENTPGRGKLLVTLRIASICVPAHLLSKRSILSIEIMVGAQRITPQCRYMAVGQQYETAFLVPCHMRNKIAVVHLSQVDQNELYPFGNFNVDLGAAEDESKVNIISRSGKEVGTVDFKLTKQKKRKFITAKSDDLETTF